MRKPTSILTPHQQRVAELKATGASNREIAVELGIERATVKSHLKRARRRAVAQRPALKRYAEALSTPGKPAVKFKPFSLLPSDHA